jgi:hypothetical protein
MPPMRFPSIWESPYRVKACDVASKEVNQCSILAKHSSLESNVYVNVHFNFCQQWTKP